MAQIFVSIAIALGNYFEECASKKFAWQEFNCAHFILGWWNIATGDNVYADVNMPTTAIEAREWLKDRHATLVAEVAQRINRKPIKATLAQVGDIVVLEGLLSEELGVGTALGICNGQRAAVLGPAGMIFVPMHLASFAFRLRNDHAMV